MAALRDVSQTAPLIACGEGDMSKSWRNLSLSLNPSLPPPTLSLSIPPSPSLLLPPPSLSLTLSLSLDLSITTGNSSLPPSPVGNSNTTPISTCLSTTPHAPEDNPILRRAFDPYLYPDPDPVPVPPADLYYYITQLAPRCNHVPVPSSSTQGSKQVAIEETVLIPLRSPFFEASSSLADSPGGPAV